MIKGIVRCLDDLGRITIPKEMRKSLKVKEGDPLDIYLRNGVICAKPAKLQCVCCENEDESKLVENMGVLMCRECVNDFYSKTY